jgi:hypothetical protein
MGRACGCVRKSCSSRVKFGARGKLTFGSVLSLPPPKTKPGLVGSASGFPPLIFVVGIGEGECAGEATRGFGI